MCLSRYDMCSLFNYKCVYLFMIPLRLNSMAISSTPRTLHQYPCNHPVLLMHLHREREFAPTATEKSRQRRLRCQHRVTSSIPSCRVAQTGNQVSLKVWDVAHVSPFLSSSPGKAAHALLLPRALAAAQLLASSPARRLPITSLAGAHATSAACLANAAALGLAAAVRRGSFAPLTGR